MTRQDVRRRFNGVVGSRTVDRAVRALEQLSLVVNLDEQLSTMEPTCFEDFIDELAPTYQQLRESRCSSGRKRKLMDGEAIGTRKK